MTTFDTTVRGTAGNDVLGSTSTSLNQLIRAGAGDDVLRGGKGDDRLVGGAGDDIMSGGKGADQFYFNSADVGAGQTDTDRIVDLNFADGDTIVFDNYGAGFFADKSGLDAFDGGNDAIVSSFAGLKNLVNGSGGAVTATNGGNNLLILTITYDTDHTQIIRISNGWTGFDGSVI
ncbi:hypothetical protein H7F50_11855 [Novosphingobium flavum]|uniref:calcium-binding protein n=1 Tax=Novosphingobium aerophilum TaxID=2839843 RepID=UPI001639A03A|nr:hypothetical protein [Novosphingobium aerophilum]MBC2662451.1 hypothetical protein [Novosphingobium aerophilum]